MKQIELLKHQHGTILDEFSQIAELADQAVDAEIANTIYTSITLVVEKMTEHLFLEDDFLYPALMKSINSEVRDTASLFAVEFGGVKLAFEKYCGQWDTATKIADCPEQFLSESKALISVLKLRIAKEEDELFPLFIAAA